MAVTIRDIARRLHLSDTTISRVLNGKEGAFISKATRERVLTTAREMGYQPNRLASALAKGNSHMVALWINKLHTSFYTIYMRHLQQQAFQRHLQMMSSEVSEETGSLPDGLRPYGWPIDGIIAVDIAAHLAAYLQANPTVSIPIISMGVFFVESVDFVGVDLAPAVIQAVHHLLESGRGRVAYMGVDLKSSRYHAYTATMEQAGQRPEYIIVSDELRSTARQVLRAYISEYGHPDGIFCHNDDVAIGAYRGLRDLNLRIPEDVALVGCDGIEDTEYLDAPLSTIIQPIEQLCQMGWRFLERRMQDQASPLQQMLLPAELVIRESSKR